MTTESTYSTETPQHAVDVQRMRIESIRRRLSAAYRLEMSDADHYGLVFFSLRSDRWYDSMLCGHIGPRGGLKLTVYGGSARKRKDYRGRAAWHQIDIECRDWSN